MFYLTMHSTHFIYGYMGEREMFYLTMHSTHFIYGYMASDIWLRTILIVRKETRCRHIGYSYQLTARVLLYAPWHWLEWEMAQWVHPMKDRSDNPPHHERMLYFWAMPHSLRLYGVGHMVKNHSDCKRENLLPPHGLLLIRSKGLFICTITQIG